jgi:hypothetical protein
MSHHRHTETKSWSIQTQYSLLDLHRWGQYGGGSSTSQSRIIDFKSRTLAAIENAKRDSEVIFLKRKSRQVDTFIHVQDEDSTFGDVIYN